MNIRNSNFFQQNTALQTENGQIQNKNRKSGKTLTISASQLGIGTQRENSKEKTALKKTEIQKKAMKRLMDTYADEKMVDDAQTQRGEQVKQLRASVLDSQKQIADLEEGKEKLKEQFGVTEETAAENTEYQEAVSAYDEQIETLQGQIHEAEKGIKETNSVIRETDKARLKTHAMVDASKEAEQIEEAGRKELISMLVQESKETIDDQIEEVQKKAAEKKEEEKEKEKLQEKGDVAEKGTAPQTQEKGTQMETLVQAEQLQEKLTSEVKQMVNSGQLTQEDVKGILVDQME